MRGKYLTELENASQLIRQQHDTSEAMTVHFRQDGLQLREACAQYVQDRENASKEEMEQLKLKLSEQSHMMADNNEMIMEYGQQAVAVRDEQLVEMQSTIDELTASLSHKDNLIAIRDDANRDHIVKVRDMKNMIQEREEEYNRKHNELEVEIRSLMRLNENESATREWYTNRFIDEKNEFRQFKHDELSAFKEEITIERVKDELMDENMVLIESTNQLRTRVAELLGSRFHAGSDEDNAKVNEELREELRKANMEISRLQETVESNPKLTEALIDAEEAEADGYKKLYQSACSERDHVIRKNDSLKQSLHDAKRTMGSMPASWSRVATRAAVPASPSAMPPTSLIPRTTASTGMTPSFAVSISTPMGTPKASSTTKNHDPALPPPPSPSMSNAINNQTNSEIDDLREKLRRSEERAQRNYDEMKEYQSWLEQAEEGQESLKDSKPQNTNPFLIILLDFGNERMAKMLVLQTVMLVKMAKIG